MPVLLQDVELTQPWFLLAALVAIPALLLARRAAGRVVFSSLAALPARGASWRTRLDWLPDILVAVAVIALAVALAGPRAGQKDARVRREGIAIAMVVDLSSSMQALDLSSGGVEQTRLDAVKKVFERFVLGGDGLAGRSDDAIGLVSFARYADTRSPLTLDHGNLVTAARSLALVSERSEDGTAIGDGLALGVERLRESPARSRVAILLTDGVSNAGVQSPLGAAELAKELGIKVYTIGTGSNGTAPVRVDTGFGSELRQVPVEIDEETLRAMAERTGGAYFRATDAAGLADIYERIDGLERTELVETRFLEYHELYGWFVGAGLALAVIAFLLRGSVLRRLP
jgi:Ca-activated chloride channel family protein